MSIAARQGIAPPPRRNASLWERTLGNERVAYALVGIVGFLVVWELGSRAGYISETFFSRPTEIVAAGIREIGVPRFWTDVRTSLTEFAVGYILAIVIGVPVGLAAGWFTKLQWALDPWLNFFNSLPRIALIPILMVLFGFGFLTKTSVVFLGAFFSIVIPTIQGVRTVDRRYLDVATSFRAPRRLLFTSVVGPATVPFIVTGLRLGMARALIGVVTAELMNQDQGLGVMIRRSAEALDASRMLFGVLIFTIAGIVGVELIRRFERRFQKWRPSTEVRR